MANMWARKPIAVLQAEAMEGEVGALPAKHSCTERFRLEVLSRLALAPSLAPASLS